MEVTLLQGNAAINQPNLSIIKRLREEMLKLHEMVSVVFIENYKTKMSGMHIEVFMLQQV